MKNYLLRAIHALEEKIIAYYAPVSYPHRATGLDQIAQNGMPFIQFDSTVVDDRCDY